MDQSHSLSKDGSTPGTDYALLYNKTPLLRATVQGAIVCITEL